MVLMIKEDLGLDWNNPEQVLNFEEKIEQFRKERASWKWTRKISWFAQRFLPSLFLVVLLYGSGGYIIHRYLITYSTWISYSYFITKVQH